MKTVVIDFLKKNKAMKEFEEELLNIGNYTAEEAIKAAIEDCAVVSLFADENYLQYDTPATEIDWDKINRLWIKKLEEAASVWAKNGEQKNDNKKEVSTMSNIYRDEVYLQYNDETDEWELILKENNEVLDSARSVVTLVNEHDFLK